MTTASHGGNYVNYVNYTIFESILIFAELLRCQVKDRHEGHVKFVAQGLFLSLKR